MASPSKRRAKLSQFEAVEGTLYLGRDRLGRFAEPQPGQFEAFGDGDKALGVFSSRAEALQAIRAAAPILGQTQ